MNQNYIKDAKQFNEALHWVQQVFDDEQRLPEQVFKRPFKRTKVFDFDAVMSASFWSELERLMELSGDTYILMAVLDPHPVDYFCQEFSQYNWCVIPKGITADEYWNRIEQGPEESPADAILYNSELVVWLSPSMKWAVWGERSYGICIAGLTDEMKDYSNELDFPLDQAINELVTLNFKNAIPEEVISKLKRNYSSEEVGKEADEFLGVKGEFRHGGTRF